MYHIYEVYVRDHPCVAIQKDKYQFWLKFSNTAIRKKITWFLNGFVHMPYESVDGKEIIIEGVLSISRVFCPFVATDMLGEGHRPSPGGFSDISVVIRRISDVLEYFLFWAKTGTKLNRKKFFSQFFFAKFVDPTFFRPETFLDLNIFHSKISLA